jgi:hypothetical protein
METIAVHVRCRKNGRRLRVIFTRDGGHYFQVREVRAGSSLSAAIPEARLLESGLPHTPGEPRTDALRSSTEVSIWELDWQGSSCPYCGEGAELGQLSVLSCGKCGGLICGDGGAAKVKCHHCNTRLHTGRGGMLTSVKATHHAPPVRGAPALPPATGLIGSAKRLLGRERRKKHDTD